MWIYSRVVILADPVRSTMSSPFSYEDAYSRSIVSDEGVMDESDLEHLCSVEDEESREVINCWYGKLEFSLRLAKVMLQNVKPGITRDELDVSVAHLQWHASGI